MKDSINHLNNNENKDNSEVNIYFIFFEMISALNIRLGLTKIILILGNCLGMVFAFVQKKL